MVWAQIGQCSVELRGDVSGPFGVTVQDDYDLCIVDGRTAHWPVVAFVRNPKPSPSPRIFS